MTTLQAAARISLKNILVTTDFSNASGAALPYALAFARLFGAKLVVAHVVAPEPHLMVVPDRLPAQDDQPLTEARLKLLEFAKCHGLEVSAYRPRVKQGELADVIPELIREGEVDLVVVGTHGRRGFKKMVLGSGAETIYRVASCPVLTVGPGARGVNGKPWKIRRILFPVDLERGVAEDLRYGLSLAEENEAEFILLNASPMVPWQHRGTVEDRVREQLAALIPPEAELWCNPEAVVCWDHPAEAVVRVAEEKNVDLIVMGVNRASAARLSSHRPWPIASEVVSRAPCPVLTVRN